VIRAWLRRCPALRWFDNFAGRLRPGLGGAWGGKL
jgi:hypothetical protein